MFYDNKSLVNPAMEIAMTTTDFASLEATSEANWKFTDPTQRKLVGGMLIFIGLAGLVGNAVVIVAFVLSKRLQNITNVFVINLAVSDFLSSMLVPFFVQNVLTEREELLAKPLCAMIGILLYVFVSSSIVNHAVIAFNRYYSISRPDAVYRKLFSPRRIAIMLVLIWTYSSVIPLATHLSGYTEFGHNSKYRICSLDINERNARTVSFVRAIAVDVVCLVVIVFFYLKFFLFIKRHSIQLMHIYSTERKGSEPSSDLNSTTKRGSDVSCHVNGMTRQSSTVTRVVDIDDGAVETVVSGSNRRPILWRQMGRSVSQTVMTPVEAFNGYIAEDIIREEDELRVVEDDKSDHNPDSHIEGDVRSETLEENSSSEKRSAIIETPQENTDLPEPENSEIAPDTAEPSNPELESHERDNDTNNEEERHGSISEGQEVNEVSESTEKTENVSSNNFNRDNVEHSSSTEDCHRPDSTVSPTDANSSRYRQERNSSSESPTHSAIANQRRRISEFIQRSFFGRSSSVNSHSERIRCMQVRLNRRQVQITKNLFVVVCAFLVCVSQYAVFLIVPQFEQLLPYSAVLLTVSHAINPFIYAIKHPTFKVVIWPMLMCKLSKIPGPSKVLKAILRN